MICPKCSHVSADDAKFCGSCGEPLGAPTATPNPNPAGTASAAFSGATAAVGGALPGILERAKNILLTPKSEWPVIEPEPTTIAQLYTSYIMPLAGLSALLSFVHYSVIGVSIPFGGTYRWPLLNGVTAAVLHFVFGLLGLFLMGFIIRVLAPKFGGVSDQRQAMKTAAYAFTPGWLSSILALLGGLGALLQFAAGIYGIYLLYLGLPVVMRSAREKAGGYTAAVVVCTIIVGIGFGMVAAAFGGFNAYGGFGHGGMTGSGMTQEERQQQAAAEVGNVLGGALGTDQKGKEGLGTAINNLAEAGRKMQQEQAAAAAAAPAPVPTSTDAANPQANPAAATAGLLTALGGAMGGSRRADPVDFHTLKDLLPSSLPDLTRKDAEGSSQQALGVKNSSASATYDGQSGARETIKISDMSAVAGLLDLATSMGQVTSSESDSGFEKDATVAGRTVHEKYTYQSKHGDLTIIVAKRFMVEFTGDGMDMPALEQSVGAVDFSRLDSLKDSGVHAN